MVEGESNQTQPGPGRTTSAYGALYVPNPRLHLFGIPFFSILITGQEWLQLPSSRGFGILTVISL
jgi:hypothetical protein